MGVVTSNPCCCPGSPCTATPESWVGELPSSKLTSLRIRISPDGALNLSVGPRISNPSLTPGKKSAFSAVPLGVHSTTRFLFPFTGAGSFQ
jgi:hypothetical protein